MSPSKKSTAPKKPTETSSKPVKKSTGKVNEHEGDVVAQSGVQPTTNTTNLSSEQHNSPALSEEAIRQRAYELYEQRGGDDGRHHEDWFRAEQEILERRRNHQ